VDIPSRPVAARVLRVVRCLDAHGKVVSLSAHALGRGSANLQGLLRWAYSTVRPDMGAETVTVSFLEEPDGQLQLEYLVLDDAPLRWARLRRRSARRRQAEIQAALARASIIVTSLVEAAGALAAATCAQWADGDSPDFVDVVLDGTRALRLPRAVHAALDDDAVLNLLRGTLTLFVANGIDRLVIGTDPDRPGHYREAVVGRSPVLLRFLQGGRLTPAAGAPGMAEGA